MDLRSYRFTLALMLICLLGIVGFQAYGLWTNYRQQEQDFDRDVMQAMREVRDQLIAQSSYVSTPTDSNSFDLMRFSQDSSLMFIFKSSNMNFPLMDSMIEQRDLRNSRQGIALDLMQRVADSPVQPLRGTQEWVVMRHIVVCDTCTESEDLTEYFPIADMLTQELAAQGIELPFAMGLHLALPEHQQWTFISPGYDSLDMAQAPYQLTIQRGSQTLHLKTEGKVAYLLNRLSLSVLWSLLLVALVFGSFGYALSVIRRQKQLSDLKTDFINNMTHEFKTPIATIDFALANIENEQLIRDPHTVRRFTQVIKEENRRMNHQVEQVLQAARADREAMDLQAQTLDLHELLLPLCEAAQLQVAARGGQLSYDFQAFPAQLRGDRVHLGNLFANLLDNAQKYSPHQPVIHLQTRLADRGLEVHIADQGIGMSREVQRKIFDKFYRVSTGNLHNVKGFGLGLSYAQQVVEQHGGQISVESEVGQGSTFVVFLPFQAAFANE
jgi:signal transduction histidine kinase